MGLPLPPSTCFPPLGLTLPPPPLETPETPACARSGRLHLVSFRALQCRAMARRHNPYPPHRMLGLALLLVEMVATPSPTPSPRWWRASRPARASRYIHVYVCIVSFYLSTSIYLSFYLSIYLSSYVLG